MRITKLRLFLALTAMLIPLLAASCTLPFLPGTSGTVQTQTPAVSTTAPDPAWTPPATTSTNTVLPDFVSVVARVKPSVVAINTEIVILDVFNRQYTQQGAGSGWVLDKNGIITTNNHVIEGARTIRVTLDDGSVLPASVIGRDALADLAVLKVDRTDLTALPIGNSDEIQIGEWVMAIGNALGEGISATEGIISRTGVSVPVETGQTLSDLIQTSAAINPGNSGGPLVNMKGEVIGITSAKLSAVGVEGMGYAISTKTALPTFQSLVQKGYVSRPFMGVELETVNPWLVLINQLAVNSGAYISVVVAGGPAEKAGLKTGDVITAIEGKNVATADDAIQIVHNAQIGQTVQVTYYRGKDVNTVPVTLIESPPA